tara:strand:- start:613 stop:849 length:237 start_codon:yes stop_codon:yes gene_type:complete
MSKIYEEPMEKEEKTTYKLEVFFEHNPFSIKDINNSITASNSCNIILNHGEKTLLIHKDDVKIFSLTDKLIESPKGGG